MHPGYLLPLAPSPAGLGTSHETGRLERRPRFVPLFWHAAFPAAVATLPYVAECTIVASSGNLYSLELSTWHQKRATST